MHGRSIVAKYGKEDVYVIASDGTRVIREMLSEYEKTIANMPKSDKSALQSPENFEDKQKEENMSEDKVETEVSESNLEVSKVQDDAIVINYIMLARIYDLLTVIGDSLGKGEDIMKLMELHKSGQLMCPPPIIQTMENDED